MHKRSGFAPGKGISRYVGFAGGCSLVLALTVGGARGAGPDNGFDLGDTAVPGREIHHGGPPRDGIPAIDRPRFVAADRAWFLSPKDRVLGLARNGVAKAYPLRILNYHEIVNDCFGGEAVVVTFCPLCGTGMAFLSEWQGRRYRFGVSGLLYNNDVLLYDRETESLWSQIMRRAVSGSMKGTMLAQLNLSHTTWSDWRARHPDTLALSIDTGYARDYSRDPYAGYESDDGTYFPVNHLDRRYHPKERVMGIELPGRTKVYPFAELSKLDQPLTETLVGRSIRIEFDAVHQTARARDAAGTEIPSTIAFWFAWMAFYPNSEVFRAYR